MSLDARKLFEELQAVKIVNSDLKDQIRRLKNQHLLTSATRESEERAEVERLRGAYEELERETVRLRQSAVSNSSVFGEVSTPHLSIAADDFVVKQLLESLSEERKRAELLQQRLSMVATQSEAKSSLALSDHSEFNESCGISWQNAFDEAIRETRRLALKGEVSHFEKLFLLLTHPSRPTRTFRQDYASISDLAEAVESQEFQLRCMALLLHAGSRRESNLSADSDPNGKSQRKAALRCAINDASVIAFKHHGTPLGSLAADTALKLISAFSA